MRHQTSLNEGKCQSLIVLSNEQVASNPTSFSTHFFLELRDIHFARLVQHKASITASVCPTNGGSLAEKASSHVPIKPVEGSMHNTSTSFEDPLKNIAATAFVGALEDAPGPPRQPK